MTTGDPKQAVILAAVAISVVGFAFYRLMPRPEVTRALSTSPRLDKAGEEKTKQFHTVVLSNAFWHPKLGETKGLARPPAIKGAPKGGSPGGSEPLKPFGELGNLSTVENTGIDQQPKGGPTITVAAIIGTANRRQALLSFGNDELHKAQVGTKFGDLMVIAITETSVRIRVGKVERVITVGEEKQL